jgi:hypothetical protein
VYILGAENLKRVHQISPLGLAARYCERTNSIARTGLVFVSGRFQMGRGVVSNLLLIRMRFFGANKTLLRLLLA